MGIYRLQETVGAWAQETFPHQTPRSCAAHLLQEAAELYCSAISYEEEAADCYLLLLTYAHRRGFSLHEAAVNRMRNLRLRQWEMQSDGLMHAKGSDH